MSTALRDFINQEITLHLSIDHRLIGKIVAIKGPVLQLLITNTSPSLSPPLNTTVFIDIDKIVFFYAGMSYYHRPTP